MEFRINSETGEGYIVGSPSGISTGAGNEDPANVAQPSYTVGRGGTEVIVV